MGLWRSLLVIMRGPQERWSSTCGLISSPTWESAHSLNERGKGKKKKKQFADANRAPPDLHAGSLCWDSDSAPTRCAVSSCWPEAAGTDVQPEPCATEALKPSLFRLPSSSPLPSSFPSLFHAPSTSLWPSLPLSFLLAFCHLRILGGVLDPRLSEDSA